MTDKKAIAFDIDELTLGDLDYLQDQHGLDVLTQLMSAEDGKVSLPTKLLIDFVWLMLRHSNPEATIDDARAVRITDLGDIDVGTEPADPQSPVAD